MANNPNRIRAAVHNFRVDTLVENLKKDGWDHSAIAQTMTPVQLNAAVEAVIVRAPIGRITVLRSLHGDFEITDVVIGKKLIAALISFVSDEWHFSAATSTFLRDHASELDGKKYTELTPTLQNRINSMIFDVVEIDDVDSNAIVNLISLTLD